MKSPMQELIEEMKANSVAGEMFWIKKPEEFYEKYLSKEKKHLIKAVDTNERTCVDYCNRITNIIADPSTRESNFFKIDKEAGKKYYEETYNQNK